MLINYNKEMFRPMVKTSMHRLLYPIFFLITILNIFTRTKKYNSLHESGHYKTKNQV
jgi:hypothetical protein